MVAIEDLTCEILPMEVKDRCIFYQDIFEWVMQIPHKSPNFGKLLSPDVSVVKSTYEKNEPILH